MVGIGQLGVAVTGNLVRAKMRPVLYDKRSPEECGVKHLVDTGKVPLII